MGTCVVYYDAVETSEADVLGGVGDGWKGLMAYITTERLGLSAARTGAAAAALELALNHAKERKQFGRPIGKFQAVSHMLTEMHMLVDTARLQVYGSHGWSLREKRGASRRRRSSSMPGKPTNGWPTWAFK